METKQINMLRQDDMLLCIRTIGEMHSTEQFTRGQFYKITAIENVKVFVQLDNFSVCFNSTDGDLYKYFSNTHNVRDNKIEQLIQTI